MAYNYGQVQFLQRRRDTVFNRIENALHLYRAAAVPFVQYDLLMTKSMQAHLDALREAVLKLRPTGENGFEGLIAATLGEITNVPFRLASSGSQFGVDGKALYPGDGVCFEGKRYGAKIPRNEVLAKIAELSVRDDGDIDLWILGASAPVGAQLADDVRKVGADWGIATLILDWQQNDLPALAAVLAMGGQATQDFLASHIKDASVRKKALAALKATRRDKSYAIHEPRLRALLLDPMTGPGIAKLANKRWLTGVFSSRGQARRYLRQPLAPGDPEGEPAKARDGLGAQIITLISGKPDSRIGVVLGDEGNGKSWSVAQSWLSLAEKPLMVVFAADELTGELEPIEDILIRKLITQTGGRVSDAAVKRWRRKLEQWRNQSGPETPRLSVVIDGLNQRPNMDWARLMEAMADDLEKIGGRLIVTSRTTYFDNRVRPRLYWSLGFVPVPQWTDVERDEILARRGMRGTDLRPRVAASLKNPRLLAIALELLATADIEELEELGVNRLLFEYIRSQERDAPSPRPANEFAQKLREHAREILARVGEDDLAELNVFDGGLEAVTNERFYRPIEGDTTRYRIDDDGLTLALGFALIDDVRTTLRKGQDAVAMLDAIMEPIGALDLAADVVMAALTIAALDKECTSEIVSVLLSTFANVQNPDDSEFGGFASLARQRPKAFMDAARRICLARSSGPNFDWIQGALHRAKENDAAWDVMAGGLHEWLRYYSLRPERRMFYGAVKDGEEKAAEERRKNQAKIDEKLATLSAGETDLLNSLTEMDDGDLSSLARFFLPLMAGKALTPFVDGFVRWCFANALNSDHHVPHKEFGHLLRMNRIDWAQMHTALSHAYNMLDAPDTSSAGKWALINLLRATGDTTDGARANTLVAELTADWPRIPGWREVERYCATDPCDPTSKRHAGIAETAKEVAELDPSTVSANFETTREDHFFRKACAGLARFEPRIAIETHRAFLIDVLGRNGSALRQGLFEAHRHSALVTRKLASKAIKPIVDRTATAGEEMSEDDRWITAQYRQLLAFPLLDGDEQINVLLSDDPANGILVSVGHVLKPISEQRFESLLEKAAHQGDETAQFRLLAHSAESETKLSARARELVAELARSNTSRVRAQALRLIAGVDHGELNRSVAHSGWSTSMADGDNSFEAWFGSLTLIRAAARGTIAYEAALDRISPRFYGRAASWLEGEGLREIARRIDASITRAANLDVDIAAIPDLESREISGDDTELPRYAASQKEADSRDLVDVLKRMSESREGYAERNRRLHDAFDAFQSELTQARATIILERLRSEEFDRLVDAAPALAERWFDQLVSLSPNRRAALHNIAMLLAHAFAGAQPKKAIRLFEAFRTSKPFVRLSYGHAGVDLDAMMIWSSGDYHGLDAARVARLDEAATDHELSLEVLAALRNGKQELLRSYITERIGADAPMPIARALMVAGFSEPDSFNEEILKCFKEMEGFIGNACDAATYAYERNVWAHHWYEKMRTSRRAREFWRYAMLFRIVVDARFDLWGSGCSFEQPFKLFWPSIEPILGDRLKKWRNKREKKLFGDDAPSAAFL